MRRRASLLGTVGAVEVVAVLALLAVLAGCTALWPPVEVGLRTDPPTDACQDALLGDVRLVFDRTDGAGFEPVGRPGERVAAVFPFGYRLRVAPRLELLDAAGTVVATGEDVLDVGGGFGADGAWHACSFTVQRGA